MDGPLERAYRNLQGAHKAFLGVAEDLPSVRSLRDAVTTLEALQRALLVWAAAEAEKDTILGMHSFRPGGDGETKEAQHARAVGWNG